jgi:hypothetical protein
LADLLLCVLALIFAVVFFTGLESAPHSARLMSVWICVGLGISAVVLLLRCLVGKGLKALWRRPDLREAALVRQATMFAAILVYVAAVSLTGFVLPSLLFVAAGALICGDRVVPAVVLSSLTCGLVLGVMWAAGFYFPLW